MPATTETTPATSVTPTSAEIEAAQRRAARTRVILDRERGNPQEFTRLHAIMCASHGWAETDDIVAYCDLIDTVAIAERLDELMNALRASIKAHDAVQAAPDDEPGTPDDEPDDEPDAPDDGGGRWERRQLGIGS